MKTKPYVGITGITTRQQAEAILAMVDRIGLPRTHQVMPGVLASYRSLAWGELADPNQYVAVDKLNDVLINDRRLLNLIHYNSRADGLVRQLDDLLSRVKYASGVQLNIAWPAPWVLECLRQRTYITVVLQVSTRAYREVGATPGGLIEQLRKYAGLVEYVLLDPSGGLGRSFDADFAATTLEALVASELPMRWGIAGGLNPENLDRLVSLLQIYPELSWDAQGGLRDQANQLDLELCRAYLEASYDLLIASRVAT